MDIKALTHDSAEIEVNRATGYCKPWLDGRDLTMSMWTWRNLLVGTGIAATGERMCV